MNIDLRRITDDLIETASLNQDFHGALASLQDAAGLEDGGNAHNFFSGEGINEGNWPGLTAEERKQLIRDWIEDERALYGDQLPGFVP